MPLDRLITLSHFTDDRHASDDATCSFSTVGWWILIFMIWPDVPQYSWEIEVQLDYSFIRPPNVQRIDPA